MAAASSTRFSFDNADADMVFEEDSQPEQVAFNSPPQEAELAMEPPAELNPQPEAQGTSSAVPPACPRDLCPGDDNSQETTKFRKLDPKSQKDLDERALIPNALTSKADFTEMFGRYKAKWSQLGVATHGVQKGQVYDVLSQTELKLEFDREKTPPDNYDAARPWNFVPN